MASEDAPRLLSLDQVVEACREESLARRDSERGHCFELFRRAVDDGEQLAWGAIQEQYQRLILQWVYAASPVALDQEEAENFAREALAKFWRTLTTRAILVSGAFEHVGGLLKYLHQCAITTILDHQRRAQRMALLSERLQSMEAAAPVGIAPDHQALEQLCRDERVQQVLAWIRANVTDRQEQRVLYLSFDRDLAPAEIAERYPREFQTADQVRRVKERVLKRARRALEPVQHE